MHQKTLYDPKDCPHGFLLVVLSFEFLLYRRRLVFPSHSLHCFPVHRGTWCFHFRAEPTSYREFRGFHSVCLSKSRYGTFVQHWYSAATEPRYMYILTLVSTSLIGRVLYCINFLPLWLQCNFQIYFTFFGFLGMKDEWWSFFFFLNVYCFVHIELFLCIDDAKAEQTQYL